MKNKKIKIFDLAKASGLKLGDFSEPELIASGHGVDTYRVKLDKSVVQFGRKGEHVMFPVRQKFNNQAAAGNK
jgi:hypothetical protein